MTTIGSATIKLKLSGTSKVMAGFRRIGQAAKKMGAVIKRGVLVGVVAFTALAAASALAVRAAVVQEDAETKLASVLVATGNAAGFSAAELFKQASALQRVTRFGDETIINGQALIATFKNITGETFERTTEAMLDMSTVMDQDLKTSAILLGKAINDPIKGVGALTRVGVTFTEEQKETIKVLQESGKLMQAQGIILRELESQFKGAAQAAGANFGGQLAQLKNILGDLAEEAGFVLVKELEALVGGFDKTEKGVDRLKRGVRRATAFIIDAVKITVLFLKRSSDQVIDFFANIPNAVQAPIAATIATLENLGNAVLNLEGQFKVVGTEESFERGLSAESKRRRKRIEDASKELKSLISNLGRIPDARKPVSEADVGRGFTRDLSDPVDLVKAVKDNTKAQKEKKEARPKRAEKPERFTPEFIGVGELFRRIQSQFGAVDIPKKQLEIQKGILKELKKGNDMQARAGREGANGGGRTLIGGVFQ